MFFSPPLRPPYKYLRLFSHRCQISARPENRHCALALVHGMPSRNINDGFLNTNTRTVSFEQFASESYRKCYYFFSKRDTRVHYDAELFCTTTYSNWMTAAQLQTSEDVRSSRWKGDASVEKPTPLSFFTCKLS